MKNIRKEIEEYITNNILVMYDEYDELGHGRGHIDNVIDRSFELVSIFKLDINYEMVFVIAAFHDIGYSIDADYHEEVSSQIFLSDLMIKKFFTEDDIRVIAEAIVDHRASLEYEPRSIYGKLVSSADREISLENMLKRSILFQKNKHKDENPSVDQIIEYSYQKLFSKYGRVGYAKMYFPDKKYLDYLESIREILDDKNKFIELERQIYNKIFESNLVYKKIKN